jgi:VWFA-related protein
MRVLERLPKGDSIAVMQFNDQVELIQDWTTDKQTVAKALARKLHSGRRVRLSEAIAAAADTLKNRPEGSRNVVLVTDGVESQPGRVTHEEAIRRLTAARATIHVISYTELVRQEAPRKKESVLANQQRSAEAIANAGIDPTLPPGVTRGILGGSTIGGVRFDPALRRKRKAYESEVQKSQEWLGALATETGGRLSLPTTEEEMIQQGDAVARDIGAQYVVTYRPKRPLASAAPGEYRRVEIAPRKSGVTIRTRRGYIAQASS